MISFCRQSAQRRSKAENAQSGHEKASTVRERQAEKCSPVPRTIKNNKQIKFKINSSRNKYKKV